MDKENIKVVFQRLTPRENIYRSCRKKGKTIRKSIDCLIASLSINNSFILFANDKDFRHIAECFDLELMKL